MPLDRQTVKNTLLDALDNQLKNQKDHDIAVVIVEIMLGFLDDVHNISISMKELVNIQRTKR